jgi:hypothetical protein
METFDAILITVFGLLFMLGYVVIGLALVYGIFKLILRVKDMKFYGKTLWFKRGVTVQISLLYACNLACSYCTLEMPTGIRPTAKQSTLDEWKEFIKNFPVKIKEVYVSGGEPTLIKWLPELCNWLLDEGYHVSVFTDLYDPQLLLKVKNSYRFQIISTFHHDWEEKLISHHLTEEKQFKYSYSLLKNAGYRIEVDEIGYKVLPYSRLKPFIGMDGLKDSEAFRVSPDLQIFNSCYDHFLQKSK